MRRHIHHVLHHRDGMKTCMVKGCAWMLKPWWYIEIDLEDLPDRKLL